MYMHKEIEHLYDLTTCRPVHAYSKTIQMNAVFRLHFFKA